MYELAFENFDRFFDVLVDMLTDGNRGNRPGWYPSDRFTVEQFTKFEGQSKLGLSFKEFEDVFEENEDYLKSIWFGI